MIKSSSYVTWSSYKLDSSARFCQLPLTASLISLQKCDFGGTTRATLSNQNTVTWSQGGGGTDCRVSQISWLQYGFRVQLINLYHCST